MPRGIPARHEPRDRVSVLQTVQTPLGFFSLVVLVVEVVFGVVASLEAGPDRTYLVIGMIVLMFLLVVIVALLVYSGRVDDLIKSRSDSNSKRSRYELLVGPPEDMSESLLANIEWDEAGCFIICAKIKEQVTLVPSMTGPSFRVEIAPDVLTRLPNQGSMELLLKDKKGFQWKVRRFFIFEKLLQLSWPEGRASVLQAYAEDSDEQ